ncbi:unnamed protein product [Phytophthora fragariaefolia]|uniref:Unnamed protein product n=1 Tax=Phytophthora fragariaefolia TaxID=1490495 RepID=A0A9W7CSS9_9STRA|nr:unnamed protein product [Phytophthora fragariaefolia]
MISSTPVLVIPDFDRLRMAASDFAIGGILFQKEGEGDEAKERPVAFGGRKYKTAERNYSIREKELIAILFGLRLWRIYLLHKPFIVETDYKSLEILLTQKSISRRVVRCLVKEAVSRYKEDPFTAALLIELSKANKQEQTKQVIRNLQQFALVKNTMFYQTPSDEYLRLVLPNIQEIHDGLLHEYHGAKCYGHPGVERTLHHVEKDYYWGKMEKTIRLYVRSCKVCQRIKGRNTKPPGLQRSHTIPTTRWTHFTMDCITALQETSEGYDAILVDIDRLIKRAHFLRTTTICNCHRVNQAIENYLRAFSNTDSDDWDELLALVEFTYNVRYQSSISMSPFEADLRYLPATTARKLNKENKA